MEVLPVGFLRVEAEWVLAFFDESGIEAPQVPVTALNSLLLLCLTLSHATLSFEAVVDTWSVGNDDTWSVPSLCLANGLQSLCMISAHCNLSHIDVTVSSGNHAEIFLADALALSRELCNRAKRRCLRSLTARVGINLCVEHKDIHILTGSNHMVKTTVADVVACTVATDNPLTALHKVMVKRLEFLADRTACLVCAFLDKLAQLGSNLLRLVGIVLIGNPFLSKCLEFLGTTFVCRCLCKQLCHTLLHLLVAESHTETKLAEVLEQGVVEAWALTLLVLRIRSGRNRCGIDAGATRSVGNHLTVAEELADELHVWCLAATRASATELEQRLGELAVLHALLDVNE